MADWLGHTTTFGYDDNSNLSGIAYPTTNGLTATFSHDAADGLTGIVDSAKVGGVQTPFWSYGYTLDGLGQVSAASDPVQPGTVQHTYGRNALDQLTADARSGTGTTSWGYDTAYRTTGRADSTEGTGDTYGVDAAGELTSLVTKIGTATTRNLTLAYNADGDRTGQADSISGTSAVYGYDQADRLTSYTSGPTAASYAYDGDGLRASKTVDGTATAETWDVAEGLPLLLQDGAMRYIDGPGGTPIEQVDGSGSVRFYLQDHLGSVRGLADASGTITDSYSYDPYGQRTAVTGSAASTPFGYAGQYTDAETGFQYLRARYYDPATGQFLTVDPLVDTTGHPYAYAADNPANATDPSGNCDSKFIIGGLCNAAQAVGSAANAAIGAGLRALNGTPWGHALLVTINNFDNSDLSHSVIGDLQGVLAGAQQALSEAKACVQNAVACGKLALALALYVSLHGPEVLKSVVAAQLANLDQLTQEINCGRYGLAAGHLLVGFVTTFGPAKLGDLLKVIAAGEDAEIAVADALGEPTGCGCFPGDTGVVTPHGLVAIASIRVGDRVLAEDPATGKVEPERVQAVIDDGVKPLMAVSLSDGSTLKVTTNHPFYVDGGPGIAAPGWVQAGDLRVGDRLRTEDGRGVTVAALRYHTGEAHVYTLTVASDHTFFVGTTGVPVLVHNCPEPFGAKGARIDSKTLWQSGSTERIDVENPAPGKRAGSLHYQDAKNVKHQYDPSTGSFVGLSASASKKLLAQPGVRAAIEKGLRFLGEG